MELMTLGPQDQPVLVKIQAASDGMQEVKAQDQLILHFNDLGLMPNRHLPQLKLQGCRQQLTIHQPELLPPSLPSPVQDISPHNDHRGAGVNETQAPHDKFVLQMGTALHMAGHDICPQVLLYHSVLIHSWAACLVTHAA
ncbi:UNVERIFIED_CONTAM: hypothetical protein FKN15_012103 [Acipenser sinensis]